MVTTLKVDLKTALDDAWSEIQAVGDEWQEWYDNMPESLQGSDKGCAILENAEAIADLQEPEIPDCVPNLKGEVIEIPALTKKRPTKLDRLSNSCLALDAVASFVEGVQEQYLERGQDESVPVERPPSTEEVAGPVTRDEFTDAGEELVQLSEELRGLILEVESLDQP